jgi:hypothetical protein
MWPRNPHIQALRRVRGAAEDPKFPHALPHVAPSDCRESQRRHPAPFSSCRRPLRHQARPRGRADRATNVSPVVEVAPLAQDFVEGRVARHHTAV